MEKNHNDPALPVMKDKQELANTGCNWAIEFSI
jgi:hypothetical protein